ncbi:MAG: hypothetical protein C5B51_07965 [Terriglobia bacterium]|nr:MAG: hypothetical protein C5B51_07965 [Terriglobia bacterium]
MQQFSLRSALYFVAAGSMFIQHAEVNVLTANGSNDRTNANLEETQLSPSNVRSGSFGKLGSFPVDGQVYSQPLYVNAVSIPGQGLRNILVIATMHNSVYAYDADSIAVPRLLWKTNLGPSVPASGVFTTYADIWPEIGILSTATIDPARGVFYVVCETLRGGKAAFDLHALDLISGAERMNGPVTIAGNANGTLAFDPQQHIQRPGLLLANNAVYLAFGSHADEKPWHGWLMSYDASDLSKQRGVYLSTPSGEGGAIWQSGRGLAADERGNVYFMTGNGTYDGVQNFGESFVKVTGSAALPVGSFAPSNWEDLNASDYDLSTGVALIPGTHTVLGGDKFGDFYVLDGDSFGKKDSGSGSSFQTVSGVVRGGMFNFALWPQPNATYLYVQGFQDPVRSYQIAGRQLNPVSVASASVDNPRGGMTISADGARNGILWETTGNFKDPAIPGTLHAFDAADLSNELWNSGMNSRDAIGAFTKFVNPTIANGKVYVATSSGAVAVFGLLGSGTTGPPKPSITSVRNGASFSADAIAPGEAVTLFGVGLGPASGVGMQLDDSGLIPTTLSDVRVLFNGVAAPVLYASTDQVSAIVPSILSSQSVTLQVANQDAVSDPFSLDVAPAAPGIFSADGSGAGQGLIWNEDGTGNSGANPAAPGSTVSLFLTGAGQTDPAGPDGGMVTGDVLPQPVLPISAQIGGQTAQVIYAGGVQGMAYGITEVKVQIPAESPAGPEVQVIIQIGDAVSQPGITMAIQSSSNN